MESVSAEADSRVAHLLLSSEPGVLERCLHLLTPADCILLLDSGVMALADAHCMQHLDGRGLFNSTDVKARGLQLLAQSQGVQLLDDDEMAARILQHRHCLSWK